MRRWTRSDGVTVLLAREGEGHRVLLSRPQQSHIIRKHYEWWEGQLAREEAEELADLLGLEEVPHAEELARAS